MGDVSAHCGVSCASTGEDNDRTPTNLSTFSLGGKFCFKQVLKIARLGSNDEPENLQ